MVLKTISGGIYEGRIVEITNDYVSLGDTAGVDGKPVFIFFMAIESVTATVPNE